jgi:hypothetical protein
VLLCVLLAWRSHVAGRRVRAERAAATHRRPEESVATAATVLPAAPAQPPRTDTTAPITPVSAGGVDDVTQAMPPVTGPPPSADTEAPGQQGGITADSDTRH